MNPFDGVDLPFAVDLTAAADLSHARDVALARELVFGELRGTPGLVTAWQEASARSAAEQERSAAQHRSFLFEMRRRCSTGDSTILSPLSGTLRASAGVRRSSTPLEPVAVADPPLSLRSRANHETVMSRGGERVDKGIDLSVDEEKLLLSSSTHVSQSSSAEETFAWSPQQLASQSSLDGLFFEALLSQHMSLALWGAFGNPNEMLQEMLHDARLVSKTICEEHTLLECLNAARFAEQRDYKRRRVEQEARMLKAKAKVAALEKLVNIGTAEMSYTPVKTAEWLRLRLQE